MNGRRCKVWGLWCRWLVVLVVVWVLVSGVPLSSLSCLSSGVGGGMPDLVGRVWVVEFDGDYYYGHTITNVGDAVAENWTMYSEVWPVGAYLLDKMGFDPEHNPVHWFIDYYLISSSESIDDFVLIF